MTTTTHTFTTPTGLDLSSRAMLVSFKVSQWTGRKLDKKVTAEVNQTHGATADAGRYNKSLVARDSLAAIASAVGAARTDHVKLSLPWLQDGTRIMTADGFARYSDTMRKHREAFETAVADFVANYAAFVEQARVDLNGMFNASDYPTQAEIERRFSWTISVLPMPDAADFRVKLGKDQVEAMQADIARQMDAVVTDAMGDAWSRLHSAVSHMAEKLTAYRPKTDTDKAQGIFRDSLVENLRELVEILPALNLTGDFRLESMVSEARDKLTARDAAELREDDTARDETAKAAADIADAMAAYMGH